jgi:hypothetical protein
MDVPPSQGATDPTRSRLWIPTALVVAFTVLVALRLHGFSLAAWHDVIDGSAPAEVLLGAPRPIRSDDWKMQLPLLLAQTATEPRFPVMNPTVGLGHDMRVPVEAPVAHWVTLFRPTMWGFFLGPDVGLAWLWWSRALGLFGVWLAVLAIVTGGRLGIAAAASALLVVSPFFQFWSLNAAPHAICAGTLFLAATALLRVRSPGRIALAGCGLALAGAWFALTLYPPYQVTLGWLVVALTVGWLLDRRGALPLATHARWRAAATVAAIAVALAIVAAFVWDAREPIEAIRNTVYPGRRLSTGGDRSVAVLLNANLGAPLWANDWGSLFNACEPASFWLLSPAVIALFLWRWVCERERVDPLAAALIVYVVTLLVYATIGVPEWLARATGLGLAPGKRTVIGLGLADVLLVARFAATARPAERVPALAIASGWLAVLAASAPFLAKQLPDARLAVLLAFAAANALLAILLLRAPRFGLPALVAISAASSLWFNPLARGGADYLRENPLSQQILAIDRAEGGQTVWAAFGRDDIGNLFRAIGVRSLGGVQPIPQNTLWHRIDPYRTQRKIYDRYAHIAFVASKSEPRFRLYSQDYVIVSLDPRSFALHALGATHVLVRDEDAASFEKLTGWTPLAVVGPNHLYRVPR